jgi:hypothetical protein
MVRFLGYVTAQIVVIAMLGASAYAANNCKAEYRTYQLQPNVYMAFATTDGLTPLVDHGSNFYCGTAGRATLIDSKEAAVANCETVAKGTLGASRCKLFDSKSHASELSKNSCSFVATWYRAQHPGYTVLATSAGLPIDSKQVMACIGQYSPELSIAKRKALNDCNRQSRLRGLKVNCKVIASKH